MPSDAETSENTDHRQPAWRFRLWLTSIGLAIATVSILAAWWGFSPWSLLATTAGVTYVVWSIARNLGVRREEPRPRDRLPVPARPVLGAARREMERAIRLNRNATSQIMDVLVELRNAPGSGDGKRHEVDPESLDRIIRLLQFEDLSSQAQAKAVAAVDQACAAIDALESGELQRKLVEEAIAEWWRNYREDCQHDLEEGGVELFDQSQDTQ